MYTLDIYRYLMVSVDSITKKIFFDDLNDNTVSFKHAQRLDYLNTVWHTHSGTDAKKLPSIENR